jgi:hypothetical protein
MNHLGGDTTVMDRVSLSILTVSLHKGHWLIFTHYSSLSGTDVWSIPCLTKQFVRFSGACCRRITPIFAKVRRDHVIQSHQAGHCR